jgi:very-short-patch-repair endonuclease
MMTESGKSPAWQVTPTTRTRARALRRDSTNAERIIWAALRAHRMNGASFRRQVPVGPYIVDFVCHAAKLAIEIDGGQHFEIDQQKRDARRSAFLNNKGFRVLRFNNYDVMTNRVGVLEVIAAAVSEAPSLTLARKRGRERTGASGDSQP